MIVRPKDCTSCKKEITTQYTEMVSDEKHTLHMCCDCPFLLAKLYGEHQFDASNACQNCNTPLAAIQMGELIGCPLCYQAFEDVLIEELIESDLIANYDGSKEVFHMGSHPGTTAETTKANQHLQLHRALSEALSQENYEEAAWIRDQIQKISQGENESTAE